AAGGYTTTVEGNARLRGERGSSTVNIAGHKVLMLQFELQYKTSVGVLDARTRILEAIAEQGDEFELDGMQLRVGRDGRSRMILVDANSLCYQAKGRADAEIVEDVVREEMRRATEALEQNVAGLSVWRAAVRLFVQVRRPPPGQLHAAMLDAAGRMPLFSAALGAHSGERLRAAELKYDAGPDERRLRWDVADDGLVATVECATREPVAPHAALLDTTVAFAEAAVDAVGAGAHGSSEATQ
ncbi:MAG: hypothetical protein ACE5O2_10055, partial [Armatimonadota bacterium]